MNKIARFFTNFLALALLGGLMLMNPEPASRAGQTNRSTLHTTPNPAAYYCQSLGYTYETLTTEEGQQGVCRFSQDLSCDAWDFLKGKCGQDKNYCAKQGLSTKVFTDGKNSYSQEYAVCEDKNGQKLGSATDLMDFKEDMISPGCENQPFLEAEQQGELNVIPPVSADEIQDLPASFDWRDYQSGDWMTPVKDQGSCGSCWAFAAVGAVEAAQNIAAQNPALDLDLSEEYLVTDCAPFAGTCCGGWHSNALMYIQDSGIPDEACMPYNSGFGCSCFGSGTCTNCAYSTGGQCANRTCSDRCPDWSSRLVTIDPSAEMSLLPADIPTIKKELVGNGPLAAAMAMSGGFNDQGIYNCLPNLGSNHVIVLVGYNDAGGYWIAKNSWGAGWNGNGYFKIGYNQCNIQDNIYFLKENESNPPQPFNKTGPADTGHEVPIQTNFSWDRSQWASSYEYCIDENDDDTCNTEWVNVGRNTSVDVSDLEFRRVYFWQVRAINDFGEVSANGGEWWEFYTNDDWEDITTLSLQVAPEQPVVGEPVNFTIQVKNLGPGNRDSALFAGLFLDNPPESCQDQTYAATWFIPGLAAGQTFEETIQYPGFTTAGSHQVWVLADLYCWTPEQDESNNLFGPVQFSVGSPPIFQDGFESGNFSAWSACSTDAGDLRVNSRSALVGSLGMQAQLDDNNPIYCTARLPSGEKTYRARFYFDPNSLAMASGNKHLIFHGSQGRKSLIRLEIGRNSGGYILRAGLLNDLSIWKFSSWTKLTDAPHWIELSWRAASSAGRNNGFLALWVDGPRKAYLTGVDNDTHLLNQIQLGAISGIDTGTRGRYYFDDFVLRKDNLPIGPAR